MVGNSQLSQNSRTQLINNPKVQYRYKYSSIDTITRPGRDITRACSNKNTIEVYKIVNTFISK